MHIGGLGMAYVLLLICALKVHAKQPIPVKHLQTHCVIVFLVSSCSSISFSSGTQQEIICNATKIGVNSWILIPIFACVPLLLSCVLTSLCPLG